MGRNPWVSLPRGKGNKSMQLQCIHCGWWTDIARADSIGLRCPCCDSLIATVKEIIKYCYPVEELD